MANFTALNIEPDDQSDDEVDNTKELQIEDALKLYQVALKVHSQGLYAEAAVAYTNLFKSEIFKFPESATEFDRLDQHPELEFADPSFALELELSAAGADGPSTLPQILYLAYKNHGQFILDCVKGRVRHEPMTKDALDYQAKAAIDNFALALASDESDTELWRRAARIGLALGSQRVLRYCLEAAVEVDDDPTIAEVEPPSLEEGFAGEQLKEHLQVLQDETSLSHPTMGPFTKKVMPQFLKEHMDPYSFLPSVHKAAEKQKPSDNRIILLIDPGTWTGIGAKLCDAYTSPEGLYGKGIILAPAAELATELASQAMQTKGPEGVPQQAEDQIMKDCASIDSPAVGTLETAIASPTTAKSEEQPVEVIKTTTTVPLSDGRRRSSIALPTRKRSQSAAGLRETPEDDSGAQKRSKRIRNRDTTIEDSADPATQYADQLRDLGRADEDIFVFVHSLLTKLGVNDLGTFSALQAVLEREKGTERPDIVANTASRDLRDILRTWDDEKASTFVNANAADILGSSAGSANAGLAAFLEHSKTGPLKISSIPVFPETEGLSSFVSGIAANWTPLEDVMYDWVWKILLTYRTTFWSESLKLMVVRIISFADAGIFGRLQMELQHARLHNEDVDKLTQYDEMVQVLFELHLDIYSRITNPSSIVSFETRIMTKDRLDRWADFSADVTRSRNSDLGADLSLRYLWASVFYATMAENVSREYKVLCWSDLQALLVEASKAPIELPNNAIMPEISVEAAEREVSRLTTMDFFFNLFQTDKSDPMAIIETLEPVLDPESACQTSEAGLDDSIMTTDPAEGAPLALRDMWKFLKSGSTSLRLFLWQRLREAYSSIGYNTKVFSCHLKSIEIVVEDLRSDDYVDSADEPRRHKLLLWLKALDDLLVKSLTIALNDAATCFEIIDERHIKSTCAALAQLNRILHPAALFDDEVRIGMTQLPQTLGYAPQGSFNSLTNKLREMQVRTWALQYSMVKEAMNQNRELFETPDNDLADYLALVHYPLGLRKACKASNKIFLKMMKVEIIRMKHVDRWEDYLGQVLFDLYGIQLGIGTYELTDHGCPVEALDRRTVLNIAEQVVVLANSIPMKDLLKHELRSTIEKMQTAVGAAKSAPQMLHNLRNYTEYLKTSIRPIDFHKAWKGQIQVDSVPVVTPESPLADKGWYFLLGMIALTKFKSQKRVGPGAQTDDMRVGATFMRLQLQFNPDNWETWYRLAQCFDYELEEEVMWSADKINNHRSDLNKLQRSSIHCYIMALSTAVRTADDSFATAEKLSEMYHEFGMRIYASSREPFGMEAFWVDDFEKHMSGSQGMYKKPLHEEMSRYKAWSHASKLFRESLKDRPNYWMNHFMLGKCLWKMYCKVPDEWDPKVKPNIPKLATVLNAFVNAIKKVPKPRDSRQEPVLEPHYKLVSIVHKLVLKGDLKPQAAADLLQQQPYAIDKGEPVTVSEYDDWEPFVLNSLRQLRNADKQHWQHRMIARVANILYVDDNNSDYVQATAAKHELRESIFTKTMHIQVWKPEAERPGRHCVYMERYVRLLVKLLWITNDKPNMESLVKRVRKKAHDFHRFNQVWSECCTAYLRLIRRTTDIQANMDEVFKSIPADEFEVLSERLTQWVVDPRVSHPALEALRESMELKKVNANLMKSTPIDDLVNDAWATLYIKVAKTLPGPDASSIPQADGEASAPVPSRNMGPMSLNNLVMDMNGTQIPVPVTFAGSEANRSRKIGISRREVLRRAELAVSRLADLPRATATSSSRPRLSEPEPSMTLGSNVNPKEAERRSKGASAGAPRLKNRLSHATAASSATGSKDGDSGQLEEDVGADDEEEEENDADGNGENNEEDNEADERSQDEESERGSVHDSADDESELSDPPNDFDD